MRPARRRTLANVRLNALINHTASAALSPRSFSSMRMAEKRAELLNASEEARSKQQTQRYPRGQHMADSPINWARQKKRRSE
jgi:hypothetical protein